MVAGSQKRGPGQIPQISDTGNKKRFLFSIEVDGFRREANLARMRHPPESGNLLDHPSCLRSGPLDQGHESQKIPVDHCGKEAGKTRAAWGAMNIASG